ncbi:hypothetical protein [Klebsiella spallanzanii]|uniref:hypothetical protein n=1 Tax=Klebsiella spallanzanii TaxID=2587528 RepID=UPI00115A32D6|nr:hypothetical protein [Klebsiella spallanzanii]VUT01791.1 hypothetical protein SB6419_01673 [Klebsiella spallanzanii]
MMKYIKKSLALSAVVTNEIVTDEPQRLELLKEQLKSRFGAPVGIFMTGIPLGISMILAILCYAMLQVSVWMVLFRWLGLPEHKVMMGIFLASVVYCVVIMSTMLLTARGSLTGYKLHLSVITVTGLINIIYFFSSGFSFLFGSVDNYTPQITSVSGLVFFCLNVMWMNSSTFYRSIALTLHNRVWRKQLKLKARQKTRV